MSETLKRKIEHIDICLKKDVDAKNVTTGFEDVILVHKSLPQLKLDEISIETNFLGHNFKAPILIDAMSGGPKKASIINSSLAKAAEDLGIGMVVGSQRVAIENKSAEKSFRIVRDCAPTAFIAANIGIYQLRRNGINAAIKCIDMVNADALVVHLNPLQELLQKEGERDFKNCIKALSQVVSTISKPIIVKETGAGIDPETAKDLEELGIAAINIAGAGGTSWAAVEYYRNLKRDKLLSETAKSFWDWGNPTAFLIYAVSRSVKIPVIASGGIRTGIDIAKSIALGAKMAAIARPLLRDAIMGKDRVKRTLTRIIYELKVAMCLTNSSNLESLRKTKYLIVGRLRDMIKAWEEWKHGRVTI